MATRKYIDCREYPDPNNTCTVAISADSDEELVEAAMQHVTSAHGMDDTPEVRKEVKGMIKTGTPR
jgi:predicted small metal-binding protein